MLLLLFSFAKYPILPFCFLFVFRFYIILDGSVGIYLDAKKDEKTIVSMDNLTFPLPPPRRMSQISISDKDGGDELSSDTNSVTLDPSSSKSFRKEVACNVRSTSTK